MKEEMSRACTERPAKAIYNNLPVCQAPFEEPAAPDVIIDTGNNNLEDCVRRILQAINA